MERGPANRLPSSVRQSADYGEAGAFAITAVPT